MLFFFLCLFLIGDCVAVVLAVVVVVNGGVVIVAFVTASKFVAEADEVSVSVRAQYGEELRGGNMVNP